MTYTEDLEKQIEKLDEQIHHLAKCDEFVGMILVLRHEVLRAARNKSGDALICKVEGETDHFARGQYAAYSKVVEAIDDMIKGKFDGLL